MGARTDESKQQPTEMHTLRRQLDEQLPESMSRGPECSWLRSQVQETWSDENIKVPKGDACLSAEGERSALRVRTEHSSWEDEGNSRGTSMGEVCSKQSSRVCRK